MGAGPTPRPNLPGVNFMASEAAPVIIDLSENSRRETACDEWGKPWPEVYGRLRKSVSRL